MSDPLRGAIRRLQNLLQVGRTTIAPNDSGPVQTVQVKTGAAQTKDAVPVTYHYGFSAHIPVGSDVMVLNVSGDSTNGVIVSTAHQPSRPKGLTDGQVLIYDTTGSKALFDNKGGITIEPSGGTTTVIGKLVVTEDATIGGIGFLEHKHGGVESGNSPTGAPES